MPAHFLKSLDNYEHHLKRWKMPGFDADFEKNALAVFKKFINSVELPCHRETLCGHITGSCLIVTPDLKRVLLTHHRKLNLWLQLGGHADGNANIAEVAYREGIEESGLAKLKFVDIANLLGISAPADLMPLDIDFHKIPQRKTEPEHIHYDIRYLLCAEDPESIVISDESNQLKWFTFAEAFAITEEPSMHRQFKKTLWLKAVIETSDHLSLDNIYSDLTFEGA